MENFDQIDQQYTKNWKDLECYHIASENTYRWTMTYENFRSLVSWEIIEVFDQSRIKIAELKLSLEWINWLPVAFVPDQWSIQSLLKKLSRKKPLVASNVLAFYEKNIWFLYSWNWVELDLIDWKSIIQLFLGDYWDEILFACLVKYHLPLLKKMIWNHIEMQNMLYFIWITHWGV